MQLGPPKRLLYAMSGTSSACVLPGDDLWVHVPPVTRPPDWDTSQTELGLDDARTERPRTPCEAIRPPRVVRGWRIWRLVQDEAGLPALTSLSAEYEWAGPVVCDRDPPGWRFTPTLRKGPAGFHAFTEPEQLDLPMLCLHQGDTTCRFAMGECELFGLIVEHERGYRAQGMVIRYLSYCDADPFGPRAVAERLALTRRYRCEVEVVSGSARFKLPRSRRQRPWRFAHLGMRASPEPDPLDPDSLPLWQHRDRTSDPGGTTASVAVSPQSDGQPGRQVAATAFG